MKRAVIIGGDGIGPEVISAAVRVLADIDGASGADAVINLAGAPLAGRAGTRRTSRPCASPDCAPPKRCWLGWKA